MEKVTKFNRRTKGNLDMAGAIVGILTENKYIPITI